MLTTKNPTCRLDEEDIMWIDFGLIEEVTTTHIVSIYHWHVETDYTPKAVVNLIPNGQGVSLEVIRMLEKEPFSDIIICSAIVVNSKLLRFFSRLYLPLHNPPYPLRLFATADEALQWTVKTRKEKLGAKEG